MSRTPVPTTPTSMHPPTVSTHDCASRRCGCYDVRSRTSTSSRCNPTDVRADLDVGRVHTFGIGEEFLLLTTVFVVVPSLMIIASPPRR